MSLSNAEKQKRFRLNRREEALNLSNSLDKVKEMCIRTDLTVSDYAYIDLVCSMINNFLMRI